MAFEKYVRAFTESYSAEAMESIDNLSTERGLVVHKHTIPLVSLSKAKNTFLGYMKEFVEYKNNEFERSKTIPIEKIKEHTNRVIQEHVFEMEDVRYENLPQYISEYVQNIKEVDKFMEETNMDFYLNGLGSESIDFMMEATDTFLEKYQEKFNESMDKILTASGYKTKMKLNDKTAKPIFL